MPDKAPTSTEIAEQAVSDIVNPLTGELMPTPPDWMHGLPVVLTSEDITEDSFERIMNASTAEEIFFNPESEGLRDLSGQVIIITEVNGIAPSTIRDHEDEYYLRFTAVTSKGVQSLSTGSPFAGRQIVSAARKGVLPRRVRVLELQSKDDPTRTSLWVVDAGAVVEGSDGDQPF